MQWKNFFSSHSLFIYYIFLAVLGLNASSSSEPDFQWPVDIPIQLSGTFGELRSNHFHAGLDIKSPNGLAGTPVLSAEEGYIYRIKIQAGGYGNALYIKHQGGYSTVYAHLDRFEPEIEAYVRKRQYEKKKFALNLYPGADVFPVKKGQIIGAMGNSGYSFGPHLHFEIRQQEVPVNALKFLALEDKTAPIVKEICLHPLDSYSTNDQYQCYKISDLGKDTIYMSGSNVGVSAWCYDPHNNFANKNGIYRTELKMNDVSHFKQEFNSIPFSLGRYANACMNYHLKKEENKLAYRMFRLPGNRYQRDISSTNNGKLNLSAVPKKISCTIEDFAGNKREIVFWLASNEKNQESSQRFNFIVPHNEDYELKWSEWTLSFPKHSVYHDLYLSVSREKDHYVIGDESTPLHQYIDVVFDPSVQWSKKHFIKYCDRKGNEYNVGGKWNGTQVEAKIRDFGEYGVGMDTIAPQILPLKWNQKGKEILAKWKMEDNVNTRGKARGLRVEASLNGKWTLLKVDAKTNTLSWQEMLGPGKHFLEIRVTDDRDNHTIWNKTFNI